MAELNKIFRAYDIRGIYPTELNFSAAYQIAWAYFTLLPGDQFVIGYDMRHGSLDLARAFKQAADDCKKQLVTIGMCTTDRLYFATAKYNYAGGIMITASHNPKEWAGIKLLGPQSQPVNLESIKAKAVEVANVPEMQTELPRGVSLEGLEADYAQHLLSFINPDLITTCSVCIDAGNGLGGLNSKPLWRLLPQIKVHPLYFEPNANFPHHEANPAVPLNTKELCGLVKQTQSCIGIAFDGDGDRCFLVDEQGNYVPGDFSGALLTRIMLERSPGNAVVYDYRKTYAVELEISRNGGKPVQTRTGGPAYKQAMRDHNAVLGVEPSGHTYFRDNFFADSGIIAALIILEYIHKQNKSLSSLVAEYRERFFSCPEINLKLEPEKTHTEIWDRLKKKYHNGRISEPDGLVIEFAGWRMSVRQSNTENQIRINVEASSETQLNKAVLDMYEQISDLVMEPGEVKKEAQALSPEDKFNNLIQNLWFTWNPHYILPFIDLYGDGWRRNMAPKNFSSVYGKQKFTEVLQAKQWEVDQNERLLNDYMANPNVWFGNNNDTANIPLTAQSPIAYFCMEYGLVDWLQIYSGGLGILAGDFLKQASDLNVPFVAIGLFYRYGYFHQDFNEQGYQVETYLEQDPNNYPVKLLRDEAGSPVEVFVEIIDHQVWARVWQLQVGRCSLYLLDTNYEKNEREEDRMITGHLYGGNSDTRIRQEILLGIGGARALKAMGISPKLYHMNEGHSGFLVLENAKQLMESQKVDFATAIKQVDDKLVFTNHTLRQAGNDIFDYALVQRYLSSYLDDLKIPFETLFELGRDQLYAQGNFSMTMLGMRNARFTNAVSKLHGVAAKKLWPDYSLTPITNGVHMPTWVCPEIHQLLDKYISEDWHDPIAEINYQKVFEIPKDELWNAHKSRRYKLINSLNNELDLQFDPDFLTIAWARRFTSYKRPDLIIHDLKRLADIVNQAQRPVQIILTGKAHPQDHMGKELLQQMWQALQKEEFRHRVVLIPGYNWQLARRMVSGADIWLNTPFRYEEASGTSGMKAAANGVLQFTTLDGWTDEVDWQDKGWVISEQDPAHSLYDKLEQEIAPLFYKEDKTEWAERMQRTMLAVLYNYSTLRMWKEYMQNLYRPIIEAQSN